MSPYLTHILTLVVGFLVHRFFKERQTTTLEKDKVFLQCLIDNWKDQVSILKSDLEIVNREYHEQLEKNKQLIQQKSSQATKSGNYYEILSPITDQFPVNIYDKDVALKWLGNPIDYIAFDFNRPMITIIEVKSGDSRLSSHQKLIKKMVQEGLVEFKEIRLNSDGKTEVLK